MDISQDTSLHSFINSAFTMTDIKNTVNKSEFDHERYIQSRSIAELFVSTLLNLHKNILILIDDTMILKN